ncbi:Major facilitator superfamily domain general substrate transporter, partial [Penicillium canescens]
IKALHNLPISRNPLRSLRQHSLGSNTLKPRRNTQLHWTVPDYPHCSRGLSPEEQKLTQQRLIEDGVADQRRTGDDADTQVASIFTALLKALSDWRSWILAPAHMTILGALPISYFYPILINGTEYTSTMAQYMIAP